MDIISGLIALIILIFSAILHEVAHGYVAERFGDPTARLAGRLTLNPQKHIDPFMSILLPLLLLLSGSPVIFGAAKPVPIDPFNLKEGRKDVALVALAGPLTNLILAVLASLLFRVIFPQISLSMVLNLIQVNRFIISSIIDLPIFILGAIVHLNLLLAIFNLFPIPPLDGSKVFSLLLPEKYALVYLSLSSIGIFIIIFLLFFPVGGLSLENLIANLLTFSEKLLGL